jgi:8-oxo-dGTP pyrophosphatase MutT (NUDIX family)
MRAAMSTPSPALPSSTVLLLRDDRGTFEVFMVQRHHQIDFASSALVFPGGKVDAADRDPALRARCRGADGIDDERFAILVSAVRETFEECGVLLARRRGETALLPESAVRPLETHWRADLVAGRVSLRAIAEAHDLELALDALVPFAHWITPEFMPKRFDTHFFLVPAPRDQVAAHDGEESVDSIWIAPAEAVADAKARRRPIIFPTLRNLIKLARATSVADAIERARCAPVVTVLPTVGRTDAGPVIRIPAEADYDITEAPLDEAR